MPASIVRLKLLPIRLACSAALVATLIWPSAARAQAPAGRPTPAAPDSAAQDTGRGLFRTLANPDAVLNKVAADSSYVQEFPHHFHPSLFFQVRQQTFGMQVGGMPYGAVAYNPNSSLALGLGGYYRNWGLMLSFNLPFLNQDNARFGRTRSLDLQLASYGRRWGLDVHVQRYQGFYIDDPDEIYGNWNNGGPFPQRPDVRTLGLGASAYYVFNHERFSYRAAFIQTERQLRSAGTWLVRPSLSYYQLKADSALLPLAPPDGPAILRFTGGEFVTLGVLGGYAHTFVLRQTYYVSLTALPGFSATVQDYHTEAAPDVRQARLGARLHTRIAAGANFEQWYFGAAFASDWYGFILDPALRMRYTLSNVRLFVGRRLDARGWLRGGRK